MGTKIFQKLLVSILVGILSIVYYSCNNSPKIFHEHQKKDSFIIKQYHDKVREERGSNEFYISSKDFILVRKNFMDFEVTEIKNVKRNDNVFFFDTLGSVQYQAYVSDIETEVIYIICEDIKNEKKYRAELDVRKIKDLHKDYPYDIKIFRPK